MPPLRYFGEPWSVEVNADRAHTIDMTDRSVLVMFGLAGPAETIEVRISCECNEDGLRFPVRLMASQDQLSPWPVARHCSRACA